MRRISPNLGILLCTLIFCVPSLRAQDGLLGLLSHQRTTAVKLPEFGQQIAAADFDQDQKPDGAILRQFRRSNGQYCFLIEVHVTAGRNQVITFSSADTRLAISALDVNRDGAPDLVIDKELSHRLLKVYLNNGHGSFYRANSADYTFPDSLPFLRGRQLTQELPVLSMPPSYGIDGIVLKADFTFAIDSSRGLNVTHRNWRAQSATISQGPSRAPPSYLPL